MQVMKQSQARLKQKKKMDLSVVYADLARLMRNYMTTLVTVEVGDTTAKSKVTNEAIQWSRKRTKHAVTWRSLITSS